MKKLTLKEKVSNIIGLVNGRGVVKEKVTFVSDFHYTTEVTFYLPERPSDTYRSKLEGFFIGANSELVNCQDITFKYKHLFWFMGPRQGQVVWKCK